MPETGVAPELIEDDISDYACVGDITEVPYYFIPLYNINSLSLHHQIILTENTNIRRNPYIVASGITENFDSANLTFTLTPSQYINLSHTVLDCPLSCFIDSESKKWKTKKPMPITGSTISITGMLNKVKRGFNHAITFEIELDSIAYLGRQSASLTSPSNRTSNTHILHHHFLILKPKGTSSSAIPSRTRFNYDNITPRLPSSIPKPELSSEPSSVALGKRKETDNEISEHDDKRSHTASDE